MRILGLSLLCFCLTQHSYGESNVVYLTKDNFEHQTKDGNVWFLNLYDSNLCPCLGFYVASCPVVTNSGCPPVLVITTIASRA